MRETEETARRICALDLRASGIADNAIPALVERFWPVLANEIRQGVTVGDWSFAAEEIARLTQEYRSLIGGC